MLMPQTAASARLPNQKVQKPLWETGAAFLPAAAAVLADSGAICSDDPDI
jgi:hypothetical protein